MSISYMLSTRAFLISGHITTHSRKLPFKSANSPFDEWWRTADRKLLLLNPLRRSFLAEWYFITKLGPQVSSFPVKFFGVNSLRSSFVPDKRPSRRSSQTLCLNGQRSDASSQGAAWTLDHVLRWCPQPRRSRRRRVTHLSLGRTTQIRPADSSKGL
jgi:hypothetical protein